MTDYLNLLKEAKKLNSDLMHYYTDSTVKTAWLETIIREKLDRAIYDYCTGECYSDEVYFTLNFLKSDNSNFTIEDVYNVLCTYGLNKCVLNIVKTVELHNDEYTIVVSFNIQENSHEQNR